MKAVVVYQVLKEIEVECEEFDDIRRALKAVDWKNQGEVIGGPSIMRKEIIDTSEFTYNRKKSTLVMKEKAILPKTRDEWNCLYKEKRSEMREENPYWDTDKIHMLIMRNMPLLPKEEEKED